MGPQSAGKNPPLTGGRTAPARGSQEEQNAEPPKRICTIIRIQTTHPAAKPTSGWIWHKVAVACSMMEKKYAGRMGI